jgi:hypothetical protein
MCSAVLKDKLFSLLLRKLPAFLFLKTGQLDASLLVDIQN